MAGRRLRGASPRRGCHGYASGRCRPNRQAGAARPRLRRRCREGPGARRPWPSPTASCSCGPREATPCRAGPAVVLVSDGRDPRQGPPTLSQACWGARSRGRATQGPYNVRPLLAVRGQVLSLVLAQARAPTPALVLRELKLTALAVCFLPKESNRPNTTAQTASCGPASQHLTGKCRMSVS